MHINVMIHLCPTFINVTKARSSPRLLLSLHRTLKDTQSLHLHMNTENTVGGYTSVINRSSASVSQTQEIVRQSTWWKKECSYLICKSTRWKHVPNTFTSLMIFPRQRVQNFYSEQPPPSVLRPHRVSPLTSSPYDTVLSMNNA